MDKILCQKTKQKNPTKQQFIPKRLLTLKFSKSRERIWIGKFITHSLCAQVCRHGEVFPLSSSLCRHAICLCVISGSALSMRRRFLWGCVPFVVAAESACSWLLALCSGHLLLCIFSPKCACSSLMSQEPSPLSLLWVWNHIVYKIMATPTVIGVHLEKCSQEFKTQCCIRHVSI